MIKLVQGFDIISPLPIDGRILLSSSEMKEIADYLLPDKYFAICRDDGKLYLYDKSNVITEDSSIGYGKFRKANNDPNSYTDEEITVIDTKLDNSIDTVNNTVLGENRDQSIPDPDPEQGVYGTLWNKVTNEAVTWSTNLNTETSARLQKDDELNLKIDNYKTNQNLVNTTELSSTLSNYPTLDNAARYIKAYVDKDYKLIIQLEDNNHTIISTDNSVDLPIEHLIMDVDYVDDSQGKALVITLQGEDSEGEHKTLRVPLDAMIAGLVSEPIFRAHVDDRNVHIQDGERAKWNNTAENAITPDSISEYFVSGANTTINKDPETNKVRVNAVDTTYIAGEGIGIYPIEGSPYTYRITTESAAPEWSAIEGSNPRSNSALNSSFESVETLINNKQDTITSEVLEEPLFIDSEGKIGIEWAGVNKAGKVSLTNAVNSESTSVAASALAVKVAYDKGEAAFQKATSAYEYATRVDGQASQAINLARSADGHAESAYTLAESKMSTFTLATATNSGLTVTNGSEVQSGDQITIGHSNKLQSAQSTQAVYPIKIDINGHISGYGNAVTIPTVTDTYSSTSSNAMSGKAVASAINAIGNPMVFKGSVGSGGTVATLPTTNVKVGDTYKVISSDINIPAVSSSTGSAVTAKIGDTVISTATAPKWTVIPSGDEPSGTVTSVSAGPGLVSSTTSAITSSGTLSVNLSNVTKLTNDTVSRTDVANRTYPVAIDKNDHLAVNVPWENTQSNYGNVTTDGKITSATQIATGDKIVIVDSSDSSKLTSTTISFDTSKSNLALTQAGTWASFTNNAGTVTSVKISSDNIVQGSVTGGSSSSEIKTSGTISLSHAESGVTSGSYGPTQATNTNIAPGGSITVPYITVNATGHVTAASSKALNIPGIDTGRGLVLNSNLIGIRSVSATITSSGWSAISTASAGKFGFKNTVTVEGITANSSPVIDINLSSATSNTLKSLNNAWSNIYRAETGANTITFYSTEKLSIDLNVNIKG